MSLYFAYTPNVKTRKAELAFFFENNRCHLTHSDRVPRISFEFEKIDLNTYKQIVAFAEKHRLSEYEIIDSPKNIKVSTKC